MAGVPTNDSLRHSSKRPRPVISCLECRRKKLKCDRTRPCQQCIKAHRVDFCSYQPGQEPEPGESEDSNKRARLANLGGQLNGSTTTTTGLDNHVNQLNLSTTAGPGVLETLTARVAHVERLLGVRNILSGTFPHAHSFVQSFLASGGDSRIGKVAQELRILHDALKLLHCPPRSLTSSATKAEIRELIPSLQVCQKLTETYFDNLEHCFRILHQPTFVGQLADYFTQPSQASDFLPQLVGVLSIAAILGIDQDCIDVGAVSDGRLIRASVSFIEDYIRSLSYKKRNTIAAFQTRSLLMLLQCMRLDRQSELWELTGSILRQALVMGMDRDPSERIEACTPFEAELRRRLWMSVVEMDMMMSILCNMPCLIPDFTCRAPKNLDDLELLSEGLDALPSRPFDEWTDGLCQCFLANSIKQRLHGCRDLQSSPDPNYDHLLSHTRLLEQVLQNLPSPLRFNSPSDQAGKSSARLMARMEVDITIRRPLMHLYTPFAYANDERDAFSEARAGFLQSCLMVTNYQDLFDPKFSELYVDRPTGYWDFFFNVYRHEINQSILGLCLEIKRLANATDIVQVTNRSPAGWRGPSYTRPSLVHAVNSILEPMTRRIAHAGADMKDLAYLTIVFVSSRLPKPTDGAIIESLDDLVAACRLQLEKERLTSTRGRGPFDRQCDNNSTSTTTPSFDFDPAWMNIPILSEDFNFPTVTPFDLDVS
ncbi:hypothetical protein DV736_g2305, partial [Chaetothyriales sp. CBS 134916]